MMKGRSKPGGAFGAEVRLATPFRSYSRVGIEAVPLSVTRAAGPSTRTSSAVAMPSAIHERLGVLGGSI